ncbi:hypothetical protein MRX96_017021 [Rhipicephalus microplus]
MATSVRRSKTERIQPLASRRSIAYERIGLPSDDETVVYCMDCSSGAAFSPWSERTGPTATSSWDEDFYTSAAAQVQQTLEAIDGYLYEESDNEPRSSVLNGELKLECERWKQQFPHLRQEACLSNSSCYKEYHIEWWLYLNRKVHLWLEMSYQHPAHEHLSPRHLHWDFDKEVHDCQRSLEGVLTVTPKLLRDRFSERACAATFADAAVPSATCTEVLSPHLLLVSRSSQIAAIPVALQAMAWVIAVEFHMGRTFGSFSHTSSAYHHLPQLYSSPSIRVHMQ